MKRLSVESCDPISIGWFIPYPGMRLTFAYIFLFGLDFPIIYNTVANNANPNYEFQGSFLTISRRFLFY